MTESTSEAQEIIRLIEQFFKTSVTLTPTQELVVSGFMVGLIQRSLHIRDLDLVERYKMMLDQNSCENCEECQKCGGGSKVLKAMIKDELFHYRREIPFSNAQLCGQFG